MALSQSFKLAIPRADGQVLRSKQVQALSQGLASSALVWLMGLPGAGKTGLAAQWVAQAQVHGTRCIWYRLDEDDADVAGVFDALRRHPLGIGRPALPAWSPDNETDLRAFARRFFARLGELGPLTVVFDDCHRVGDDSAFFELLDAAREACGDGLRLLLISRRVPPAALARGELAGWLTVYDDLALTLDEAAEVARRVSGRAWSEGELTRLQQAGGWMAHVLALAHSSHKAADVSGRVGDFLCNELMLMLPFAERRRFRLLAELPEIPRRLEGCGQVNPRLAGFLDQLTQARYFVESTATRAWRMHDLLRDGLRSHNRLHEPIDVLAAERRELAQAVACDAPDAAMNLLVAAGDEPAVLGLLQAHGGEWLAQGRHRQMLGWLTALPQGEPEAASSRVMLWHAEALLPLEPEAARPLFARSRARLVAEGAVECAYRAWCGEVASYVVQWGAVQGLADLVDDLEQLEARLGPPPGDWRFRTAADALTALMYGRAEDPRMRHYAAETAHAVDCAPDAGSRITAAAQLLIYRMWWAGDYPGGRALYNAFDAEVDAGVGLAPLARLMWWSNAAIVDWTCGDPARCYDKVDRGLALAEASGVHVRDFFLLTQGIFCALSQEDLPRAEAYLQRLARTERGHRRLDVMVHHFFRSWYCLSSGDAYTALAHAQAAWPLAEALGSSFHKVIVLSALAPARLHAGDVAGAQQAYRAQLALAKGCDNLPFTYIAFCAGAEIALMTGDHAGLKKQVERILTVKQHGGFHSDCGWRTPMRAQWLAFALDQGVLPEVARQWIREKRIAPPPGRVGEWPAPVHIEALHGLTVRIEGQAPEASAKPAAKLRELLGILVAMRHGAAQRDLCDWLWPQADGDKAAASLKASVHRLRGWLGADAVLVRDGLVVLNAQRVQCDLWCWLDAARKDPRVQAAQVLAGCDAQPVLALRERLSQSLSALSTGAA